MVITQKIYIHTVVIYFCEYTKSDKMLFMTTYKMNISKLFPP